MGELGLGHLPVGGGDVHDPAAAALIAHGRAAAPPSSTGPRTLMSIERVPGVRGEVQERHRAVYARVVHQDVDPAEVRQ